MISRIERVHQRFGDTKVIEITCKDFRTLYFSFKSSSSQPSDFIDVLLSYLPSHLDHLFAFHYRRHYLLLSSPDNQPDNQVGDKHADNNQVGDNRQGDDKQVDDKVDEGWTIYHPQRELERILGNDVNWKIMEQEEYQICDSYSPFFAVPKRMSEGELAKVKEFRSKGRIPTLSWRNPMMGNTLTRCSQPRVGLLNARCLDDEKLLFEINLANQRTVNNNNINMNINMNMNMNMNMNDDKARMEVAELCLIDARPKSDAVVNIASGAGFEDLNRFILPSLFPFPSPFPFRFSFYFIRK